MAQRPGYRESLFIPIASRICEMSPRSTRRHLVVVEGTFGLMMVDRFLRH